jgi:hypothetical protein
MPNEVDYVRAVLPDPPPPTMEDRNIVMAAVMAELGRLNDLGASPERFRQHGLWTHRVIVITVAAAILLVFFVPLPGKSMFNRIVAPTKSPTTTTTSPPVTRATQQEIKAFVALANKGLHREFTATYRTVVTGTGDLLLMTVTAAQVSWPLSSDAEVSPHLMYEESVSGSLSEVFLGALRSSRSAPGWYTCHKVLAWTCSPVGEGTEGSMLMGAYLPGNVLSGLQALAGGFTVPAMQHDARFSQKVVAGRKLKCLDFGPARTPRAVVCETSEGIIAYYSSQVRAAAVGPLGATWLVSLSLHVAKGAFVLPAKAAAPSLACQPDQITAGNGSRIGGANEEASLLVTLTNSGRVPCTLEGYPTVRLVTSTGTVLDLHQTTQAGLGYVTNASPRPVSLSVGASAYVLLAKQTCGLGDLRRASWVHLTLPGASTGKVFRVSLVNAVGDLALCRGGVGNEIAVTPVEPTVAATLPVSSASTTTTRPTPSNATAKQIDAFVARAAAALHKPFVATYEITEPVNGGESTRIVQVAQISYPAHFMYGSTVGVGALFVGPTPSPRNLGTSGVYSCDHHAASWSCDLMAVGNAPSMLIGDYPPNGLVGGLQDLASEASAIAYNTVIAGKQMSCLRFGSGKPPYGGTVCLAAQGVIGYETSQFPTNPEFQGTATLRMLSFHVTPADLTLPAKAKAAPGA